MKVTGTFVIRSAGGGLRWYMQPWNVEGVQFTDKLEDARKFSTSADAAVFRDENRGAYPVAWFRKNYEVWPVPPEFLDPLTGQYVGAAKGGGL